MINKDFTYKDNLESTRCDSCITGLLATLDKFYCGIYNPACPLSNTSIINSCYHCPTGKLRSKDYRSCGNNIPYCKYINNSFTACETCYEGYMLTKDQWKCGLLI